MDERMQDEAAFLILEEYLERLQNEPGFDGEAFMKSHPECEAMAKRLEALDRLAFCAEGDEENPQEVEADGVKKSSSPSSFSSLPREFGPYELLEEIGRGGMGVVYKARQNDLGRVVAIKMILAGNLASPEHVRRFHAEARAAAKLRHSHIVHIHEVGQLLGQDYFTMEYVEGRNLADRIAEGTLSIEQSLRILAAAARAVDYLHRQNVVHRDLKPSNILLDAAEEPYLTDFGLVKALSEGERLTTTGVIAGTPSYMAPEQAAGRTSEIGPAVDIYGLGAILYEALSGTPPFRQDNPIDTLLDVLSGEPESLRAINPKIPAPVEWICMKCLSKNPQDRYASAADLAEDVERYLRGEPISLRPPSAGSRFMAWTRRQPALFSRLGALSVFWAVSWGNFYFGAIDGAFHWSVSALVVAWVAVSFICQRFLGNDRWSFSSRFVWGTLDSTLLLATLLLAEGVKSPLLVGYPLLIAASGLWFRARFVWFMTAMSIISYGVLMADFYIWRPCRYVSTSAAQDLLANVLFLPQSQGFSDVRFDRHVIFILSLIVAGAIVSYMAKQVRSLTDFYAGSRIK